MSVTPRFIVQHRAVSEGYRANRPQQKTGACVRCVHSMNGRAFLLLSATLVQVTGGKMEVIVWRDWCYYS